MKEAFYLYLDILQAEESSLYLGGSSFGDRPQGLVSVFPVDENAQCRSCGRSG